MPSSVTSLNSAQKQEPRGSSPSNPTASAVPAGTSPRLCPMLPPSLCVALIQAQRAHSRLLDELEQARKLRDRGLVYREDLHSNRQFVDAYLDRQRVKIERTIEQLKASRMRAHFLIELVDAQEVAESAASARFSSCLEHRRNRKSPRPAGSDWVRSQVVSN